MENFLQDLQNYEQKFFEHLPQHILALAVFFVFGSWRVSKNWLFDK